jgi:hypothetical protein
MEDLMPNDFSPDDPRNVWQNQPVEVYQMSADLIRGRAQRRYQQLLLQARASIALGFVLCGLFAFSAAKAHALLPRTGWAIVSLWCAWFAYHAYRWFWPERLAVDAPFGTSLEFYRRELERRRDYLRHGWRRAGLIFCFLGLGLVVLPPIVRSPGLAANAVPFFIILTVWFVAYFRLRAGGRRKLEQEIEELRAFERESG